MKWGRLQVGDPVVVGGAYGKVRSLLDGNNKPVREAVPSDSVRLLGLRSLPLTGQELLSMDCEQQARQIAERRLRLQQLRRQREEELAALRQRQKEQQLLVQQQQQQEGAVGGPGSSGAEGLGADSWPVLHVLLKADGK